MIIVRLLSRSHSYSEVSCVLVRLREFLVTNEARKRFFEAGGFKPLLEVTHTFKGNAVVLQRIYDAVYCLWHLSFHPDVKTVLLLEFVSSGPDI